ncbi:hypothetical protein D3C73_1263280 [compost metagenome]
MLFGDDRLDVVTSANLSAHVVAVPAHAADWRTAMNHRGDVGHHTQRGSHRGQQMPGCPAVPYRGYAGTKRNPCVRDNLRNDLFIAAALIGSLRIVTAIEGQMNMGIHESGSQKRALKIQDASCPLLTAGGGNMGDLPCLKPYVAQ